MGVVYRGRDESTGAEVAVKVVSDASGAGTAGIRREIHALARVSHPGVAHVLDQGISSGKPWYAMELVRGRTLRAILSEHWRRRPEVAPTGPAAAGLSQNAAGPGPIAAAALQICADLCEPLAVVHAAGLVHRDLKPDNILVTAEGRPVLLDFGIAASFGGASGREVLLSAGEVIGTLEYMSPEQIRGDLVDARADLYALGCTLYECLTGHTPFGGRPAARILQAHLHEAPEPPSRRGAAVSPELDALVLRLLAKRPADRPGYATDIPAMLWAAGAAGPPQHGSPARVAPYLYRAELAGRDSVMARARAALVALGREGKGGAVFVIGESGVGKTRVGMEMVRAAAGLGLKVITGQCLPPGRHGATPLHPFVPAFREAPEEALYDARVRVLAPYFPEAAALVPSGSAAEPASLSPEAARARALDAAEALLLDVAAGQPLLLVLDDAQWADELSLALLGRLEPAKIAARGLLCVCLFRAEEATDTLTALSHAPGAERWSLDRLDKTSIAAIAAGMLASAHFPDAWGEVIARVSGGNPFFAEEYLRSAVEAGLLTRDRRGAWCIQASDAARGEALAVPASVDAILEERFSRLDAAELHLLAAAAVLGRTLDPEIAAAMCGLEEGTAMDAMSTLVRRQILEGAPAGHVRFVHDRLREAAYARLGPEDRRARHRAAAAAIEARHGGVPNESEYAPLANHHAAAGHHDAAHWYATLAAAQAESLYANEQAIELRRVALRAAAEGGAAAVRRAETAARLGDLLQRTGRAEEARETYARALADMPAALAVERARLHLSVGKTWDLRQRHAEALVACEEAEGALGAAPGAAEPVAAWWEARVQIGIERIQIHYWAADMEALAQVVADLAPVVEQHGTDAQRAYFFLTLVQRDLRGARYRTTRETVEYARRSVAAFERGTDREQIANALDEAEERMLAALEDAEATGNAWIRVASLAYLAMIARRRRDVDSTRALSFRCLSASEEAKLPQYAGVAEANLGWIQLEQGDAAEAVRLCGAALTRWRGGSLVYPFQWLARLPLAKVAHAAANMREAADQAQAMLEPAQQRLPEDLEEALSRGRVDEALRLAEGLGFV